MDSPAIQTKEIPSWAELKEMIYATSEQMKETDRKIEETDLRMDRIFKKMEENNEIIKYHSKEIDRVCKLYGGFTNEFGKIIEDLCKPAALKIFSKEVPGINHIYEGPRHMRQDEEEIEVDVLLCNKTAAVAVEVKTTCFKKDVDYFISQMKKFKTLFHEFEEKKIFLAIAAMRFANGSDTYARRKGLYTLTPIDNGMFTLGKPTINRKEF